MCSSKKEASSRIEHVEAFKSQYIPARNIDIWLPQNYSEDKKYNVLYMHDGQMLYDSTATWNGQSWNAGETMQKMMDAKRIKETIIVGIYNIAELRTIEYFPRKAFDLLEPEIKDSLSQELLKQEPESDHYLKFIVQELKPYIDSVYSTNRAKENTFVAGSSMGGLISMYAICEYPDVFGAAACLSTHWPGSFESNIEIPTAFKRYMEANLPSPENHKIYFDYGTETLDALYKPYQLMVDSVMRKKGFTSDNWMSKEFVGHAHKETDWLNVCIYLLSLY